MSQFICDTKVKADARLCRYILSINNAEFSLVLSINWTLVVVVAVFSCIVIAFSLKDFGDFKTHFRPVPERGYGSNYQNQHTQTYGYNFPKPTTPPRTQGYKR